METEETDTVAICPTETNVPSIECHTNISHSRGSEPNCLLKFDGMDMKGCTHKYIAFDDKKWITLPWNIRETSWGTRLWYQSPSNKRYKLGTPCDKVYVHEKNIQPCWI